MLKASSHTHDNKESPSLRGSGLKSSMEQELKRQLRRLPLYEGVD